MANYEENAIKREKSDVQENRQNGGTQNMPESLTNPIYTAGFLREQIGKLMRVEFLIGTNNLTDRIGILEEVGASYIILRSLESDNLTYADIYSIKFITISNNPFFNMNNMNYNQTYNQGFNQGYNQRYY